MQQIEIYKGSFDMEGLDRPDIIFEDIKHTFFVEKDGNTVYNYDADAGQILSRTKKEWEETDRKNSSWFFSILIEDSKTDIRQFILDYFHLFRY